MPKQPAFPGLRDAMKKKVTRREQFLAEMDAVVPWGQVIGAGGGWGRLGHWRILRIDTSAFAALSCWLSAS